MTAAEILAAFALACAPVPGPGGQAGSGFDAAVAAVGAGDFAEALAQAAREPDPLRRAQATVFARHHAGDVPGALDEARAALDLFPRDPWLLERAAELALTVREPGLAGRWLARAEHEGGLDPARRSAYAEQTRELAEVLARRDRALSRARWTASLALVATCAALAALARTPGRGRAPGT